MQGDKQHPTYWRQSTSGFCPTTCSDEMKPIEKPRESVDGQQDETTPAKPNDSIRSVSSSRMRENYRRQQAIKLKVLSLFLCLGVYYIALVEAGFFTFYLPNLFKPRGFNELSDMITNIEDRINETKDSFSDAKYFWGLLRDFDSPPKDSMYPEESACEEVFPLFRELAIEYAWVDYDYYIKPLEVYRDHLIESREKWYPAGLDSKAALPREWEQDLIRLELETKIKWLSELANEKRFKDLREKMIDIWKNVRRSLDTSIACLYLRYAYRQIANDINQVALDTNLSGMKVALNMVQEAYKRVDKYKKSDEKIIEEIRKESRFIIKTSDDD